MLSYCDEVVEIAHAYNTAYDTVRPLLSRLHSVSRIMNQVYEAELTPDEELFADWRGIYTQVGLLSNLINFLENEMKKYNE